MNNKWWNKWTGHNDRNHSIFLNNASKELLKGENSINLGELTVIDGGNDGTKCNNWFIILFYILCIFCYEDLKVSFLLYEVLNKFCSEIP